MPRNTFLADGTAAGLMFLAAPLAGYFLGKWVGQWLHVGIWPAWAGGALGLVAAFLHLLRLVNRVSR